MHGPLVMLSEYGVNILDQLGRIHVLRRAASTKHECIKPQQYRREPVRPDASSASRSTISSFLDYRGEPPLMTTTSPLLTAAAACLWLQRPYTRRTRPASSRHADRHCASHARHARSPRATARPRFGRRSERRNVRVHAPGQSRGDLLQQPAIAVRIAERGE